MHRALTAMGGLPRRAPAPTTILLSPPVPTNQSGKKPTTQGSAGAHNKCSRCKSRPKSGSGSSLCIRCKLQRDYGSPRGGFAAPRKKLPPIQVQASVPIINLPDPVPMPVRAPAPPEETPQIQEAFSDRVVSLEIVGEPPMKVSMKALRSQQFLTDSSWLSVKSEVEKERDDFLPEDLNKTLEIAYSDAQAENSVAGEIVNSDSSIETLSRPPTIVSLPEPEDIVDSDEAFLEEARQTVRQYGQYIGAAFEALRESPSDAKWVSVLSVYQKKSILSKILDRLASLEKILLPPEERDAVDRITRSVEQLFTSMRQLQGQMAATAPPVQVESPPSYYETVNDGGYVQNSAKSLTDEADEEIKKILAKLQSADEHLQTPQFAVPKSEPPKAPIEQHYAPAYPSPISYGYPETPYTQPKPTSIRARPGNVIEAVPAMKRQNTSISAPQLRNLLARKVTPLQGSPNCHLVNQPSLMNPYIQQKALPSYPLVDNHLKSPAYPIFEQPPVYQEPTLNQLNAVYDSQTLPGQLSMQDDQLSSFTNQQWAPSTSMGVYNMR